MKIHSDILNTYLDEIEEIETLKHSSFREKYILLKSILDRFCKEITKDESLQFSSLFSRLVFIGQKYNIPKSAEKQLHQIRRKTNFLYRSHSNLITSDNLKESKSHLIDFISNFASDNRVYTPPADVKSICFDYQKETVFTQLRVQVTFIDTINSLIKAHIDSDENEQITIKYNVSKINDIFNTSLEQIWVGAQLNLIDSRTDTQSGYIIPQFIVLEPDYLIDASALAECFQSYSKSYLHYFRRKFESVANSHYILLGNLANYFLDELIYADQPQELDFQEVFFKSFKLYPFEFTSCNEIKERSDFVAFMSKAENQFNNIKRVVSNDFPQNNIIAEDCTLEPSFFCEKFGIQGRLDLLQLPVNDELFKIIELKSGGLPFPKDNPGKIALNHEVQTTIYRMIIQSVFKKEYRQILSSILYSASENEGQNIRYSARYQLLEKEIVNIRNLIVATEYQLYLGKLTDVQEIFGQVFNLESYGPVPEFFTDRIADLGKSISNLTELEKAYFFRFISFISRELYIHKIGDVDYYSHSGISSLWMTEFNERQESFDLIADLEIVNIDDSGSDMRIIFKRNSTDNFVNFRVGEICILYPRETQEDTVLTNQILKGTIAHIDADKVLLRFRYKQKNKQYLLKYTKWIIEHDRLDHGYNGMFKSLFEFTKTSVSKKMLLLGIEKPKSKYKETGRHEPDLMGKQNQIIEKALAAEDYFLIVGPPGTGKTSIFARSLINKLYAGSSDNILVVAYTNRAVDELCDAIENSFQNKVVGIPYIRVGTDLSCAEPYKKYLLQNISKDVKSRNELRKTINECRIFVGTLASITGKPELFDIKRFNVAIIDEASQILEPQIVGLLTKVDRFILIGDHKQLSTITLQDENKSRVDEPLLNSIELVDCRESYFERLFRICQKNAWTWAYDMLVYQGRMHNHISYYANKHFYNNELLSANRWQTTDLARKPAQDYTIYEQIAAEKRIAFISSYTTLNPLANDKINENEADIVVNMCLAILKVYRDNNMYFDENKSIGVITPYRNQIALIKHKLASTDVPALKNIMVDTVERFQGSQRDIILLSFCINKPYQLNFFCNLNREKTVDRKLNVAITRAREQLFLIGNEYLLRQNKIYKSILEEMDIIKC